MSSAILYVAIVVIWACVLIPRWLRRGSAAEASEPADTPVPAPQRAPSADAAHEDDDAPETGADEPAGQSGSPDSPDLPDSPDVPREARPRTRSREESRRRMLTARRRLLMTLLTLETAALALFALHLAAPWVLIPPSIMLGGYLLLLREAANADAERVAREASAASERARAREAARKRAREQARREAAQPAPRRRVEIPEPEPGEYYDLSGGRDYAPGLAGKYETSDDSDVIDFTQYKRAVGD